MNEFTDPNIALPPELDDLEQLRAKSQQYEEKVSSGEFASSEDELEAHCNLRDHLRREWNVATDSDVQNRVAKMGRLSLERFVELRVRGALEGLSDEDSEEDEMSAGIKLSQAVEFIRRYGALTDESQQLKKQLFVKLDIGLEENNPWVEKLKQQPAFVRMDRHYIVGDDGSLTRYSKDLTSIDSQFEDDHRRALLAVLRSEEGLTSTQIWEHVYGKEVDYDAKKMREIRDWITSVPYGDQKLVVAYGGKGRNKKLNVAPNLDVVIDEPEIAEKTDITENPEKIRRQLESLCIYANYLYGFNDVLKDYGFEEITTEMLQDLEEYAPQFQRPEEIERNRQFSLKELMDVMENMDSLLDFVDNIIDANIQGDKAADRVISILEKAKGRELSNQIIQAKWESKNTLQGGVTVRDRRLLDSTGREIWPTKLPALVQS